ncbi:Plasmodium exported protein (PHISTa), unknown function [Plasmodium sp.]|nr:Plasmodium exported protein (PHISTa), unknown function [Plasmodium sp.]
MMNKNKHTSFTFYGADVNQKGTLHYISFKYLCLSLCIIGFYYIFLNISLENKSLEILKISSVYKRNLGEAEKYNKETQKKRNVKHKKEDIDKTNDNVNDLKCNEQKLQQNKYSTNKDLENTNVKNGRNISISSINNNNDMSTFLTEKELYEVLNSLETCPSKEDLKIIWSHTVGVAKEGFDDIQKELKTSIQKYLDSDIYPIFRCIKGKFGYERIWNENISGFYGTVANVELEYTKRFLALINGEHTLDDVLKFIYSFLEYFEILKKKLREEHQEELFRRIAQAQHKNFQI